MCECLSVANILALVALLLLFHLVTNHLALSVLHARSETFLKALKCVITLGACASTTEKTVIVIHYRSFITCFDVNLAVRSALLATLNRVSTARLLAIALVLITLILIALILITLILVVALVLLNRLLFQVTLELRCLNRLAILLLNGLLNVPLNRLLSVLLVLNQRLKFVLGHWRSLNLHHGTTISLCWLLVGNTLVGVAASTASQDSCSENQSQKIFHCRKPRVGYLLSMG